MAQAEVGDDVLGDDPTVKRLEALAAARLGKEAALFVASGHMGNLTALLTHCGRGDEIIVGDQAHMFYYEQGSSAAVGGIHPRAIPNQPDGTLDLGQIETAIRSDDVHFPRTHLICLENTHNRCGGAVLDAAYMQAVGALARRRGLRVHVDGARLFNAAIALGVEARTLVADADSVSFCLSKGLAAPIGSLLCGSHDFIQRARRNRKLLGGGMRQVGVIAAAGIVALETMVERLAEDHANAQRLAVGLSRTPWLVADPERTQSNIVMFEVTHPALTAVQLQEALERAGVRVFATGGRRLRAVTHCEVSREEIELALVRIAEVLRI